MRNYRDLTGYKKGIQHIAIAGLLTLFLCPHIAIAALSPVVKARIIRDFGRISFEWPQEVRLKTNTQGNQLNITFEQAADINAAPILRALAPHVTNVQQTNDGRSLILNLNNTYRIRSFVSGNTNGIDIVGLDTSASKNTPQPLIAEIPAPEKLIATKPAQAPAPKQKPLTPAPKKPKSPPLIATPKQKPKRPDSTTTAATTVAPSVQKTKTTAPLKPEKAAPEKKPHTQKSATETQPDNTANIEHAKTTSTPASKAIPKETAPATASAASPQETTTATTATAPKINKKVTIRTEGDDTIISFPWQERVATAAFYRAGRHFILFNKALTMPSDALKTLSAQTEMLGENVLITIPSDKSGLSVDNVADDYAWHLRLTTDDPLPTKPIKVSPKSEAPLRPHLFMHVLQTAKIVPFTDPLIGDELRIVPLYRSGEGIFRQRDFIDASLLKTAQGIVVKPHADDLRVARLRNGLKITAPDGLLLSADLPMLSMPSPQFAIGGDEGTLFPYETWKAPGTIEDPILFKNQLQRDIAAKTRDEKQRARIRFAQWHLAEGHPYEALGLLNLVEREDPFLFEKYKLHAYRGAANFLAQRFAEAEQDFSHASLTDITELKLWQDTLKVFFTGAGKLDYLDYHENFISKYPPSFRQQLALVAADTLVNRKQYNAALKIFDTLNRAQVLGPVQDYADYLIAKISNDTRQHEMATKIWNRLAQDGQNRFVQVRARYALTTMALERNDITIKEAIAQLEPLRIAWRGDQFEVNLLTLLGELYETVEEPREALRIYRELLTYYPQRQENLEIAGHMADIFTALYNKGGADSMQPLDALALYYEFRDLTPVGEEGDHMVRNLADRLVAIDLLDRAADLLDHQVRFRSSGEDRSQLGAQLALIHLLNRKPKGALDILEVTGYGRNSEKLQETRALLTARALADLDEHDRALALLEGNLTPDSEILKLRIFWEEKQWPKVIATAENIISQRKDPSAKITQKESEVLLKLAIAYIFQQETQQVQYLRDYFLPLMKDNPNHKMFSFITQDAPVNPRNMAQLTQHMNSVETFLATYRTRIKEHGLNSMVQ